MTHLSSDDAHHNNHPQTDILENKTWAAVTLTAQLRTDSGGTGVEADLA